MTCIVFGIIALISGLGLYLGADNKLNSFDFWWENAGKDSYEQMEMMRSMGIMLAVLGFILLIVGIILVIVKKSNENQKEQAAQREQAQLQWQQTQQLQYQQQLASKQNMQTDKKCPRCGNLVQEGMRFCPMCGLDLTAQPEKVNNKCAVCGEPLLEDAVFCTACGAKIQK